MFDCGLQRYTDTKDGGDDTWFQNCMIVSVLKVNHL